MSGVMPGDDGRGDTKGWDRASIALKSRKPYRPDVNPEDLLLPNEAGKLRTLWLCSACALGVTILYVFVPLFLAAVFVHLGGWFKVAVLSGSFVGLTVVLFVFSVHETRQFRRLANEP